MYAIHLGFSNSYEWQIPGIIVELSHRRFNNEHMTYILLSILERGPPLFLHFIPSHCPRVYYSNPMDRQCLRMESVCAQSEVSNELSARGGHRWNLSVITLSAVVMSLAGGQHTPFSREEKSPCFTDCQISNCLTLTVSISIQAQTKSAFYKPTLEWRFFIHEINKILLLQAGCVQQWWEKCKNIVHFGPDRYMTRP